MWDSNENCDLHTSVSYQKVNFLLELTLYFQIRFVLHIDEAVHILCKPLPTATIHNRL